MWNTRVTEILGIQYPIIEGGMAVAGNGELAAAVSNAGGLGVVSSNPGGLSAAQRIENVRDHIGRTKSLTDKPFGVNFPIFILADDADAYGDMVIEEGVTVAACSGGSPKVFTKKFKDAGLTVLHVVASVRQALSAQEAGVDIVVAEGFEAGGVNSPDEVTTIVLTPAVAAALDVPVVAAGGIGDARGFMAAMALGAEGVQMGSAFVPTVECHVHQSFKDAIVAAQDTDTLITQRALGRISRCLKTPFTLSLRDMDRRGAADEMKEFLREAARRNRKKAAGASAHGVDHSGQMDGDGEAGQMSIGQVAGLITEVKSARRVVEDIINGASEIVQRWQQIALRPADSMARQSQSGAGS